MTKLQKVIKAECSKMSGIPEQDISDETNFGEIIFPLSQMLDAIFRVSAISDGDYGTCSFADVVRHYERYDLSEFE
jgi:hypothetical protein